MLVQPVSWLGKRTGPAMPGCQECPLGESLLTVSASRPNATKTDPMVGFLLSGRSSFTACRGTHLRRARDRRADPWLQGLEHHSGGGRDSQPGHYRFCVGASLPGGDRRPCRVGLGASLGLGPGVQRVRGQAPADTLPGRCPAQTGARLTEGLQLMMPGALITQMPAGFDID